MSFAKQALAIEARAIELVYARSGQRFAPDMVHQVLIEAVLERTQGMILLAMGVDTADTADTAEHLVPSCDPGRKGERYMLSHDDGKASVYVPVSAAHACPHGVCGGKCCPLPPADAVDEAARSMLQVQEVFPGAQPQALAWQDTADTADTAEHLVPSCDPGRKGERYILSHDDGKASVYVPVSAAHACPHGVCGGKCCPLPPADAVDEAARSMLQVQEVFPGAQPQALAWQDMGNGDWMLWGLPLSISAAVYAPDEEQPEHGYEVGQHEEVLAQGLAPSLEEARLQCMRAAARVLARMVQEAEQAAMALSRGVL